MSEINISKNTLKIGNLKYFRTGADALRLGDYGRKYDSALNANTYVAPEGRIPPALLKGHVRFLSSQQISWAAQKAADVEANGKLHVFGLGLKTATAASYDDAKRYNLVLLKFSIIEGELKELLNGPARAAREYLETERKDGRVVSTIYLAVKGDYAEHVQNSVKKTVSVDAGTAELEFTASGGSSGEQTIVFGKKAVFAYGTHRVTDWNRGRTVVENMDDDMPGMR